jgi:hypothetical protein
MIRVLASVAWLTLGASASHAQMRGSVRDSMSGLPIPGAVVFAVDVSGDQIARSVTTDRGEFSLRVSRAPRRLQVLRIGFRPRVVEVTAAESRVEIVMVAIPTLLQPISVFDQPNCPRRDDSPAAFALWEQAKSALLASVVAREVNPAEVVRLHFDRRIDRRADTTDWMEVRIDSASTTKPFTAARPASAFIERGFIDDSAGLKLFHAPDAEVLLDAAFPRGYCFEIASPDAARPVQVGLGFHAARRRNGRVDIAGIVWVDTSARALTDIVYRYAGLDARFERANAGGVVSFRTTPNGTVLIERWHIRLLAARRGTRGWPAATSASADDFEIHEKGGAIASARWPDGSAWHAALGRVSGLAWNRSTPAAGARLRLFETSYEAVADSTGHFEFTRLLPGPYSIGVDDPILAPLGITLRTGAWFTAQRDSTTRMSINVPTAKDYVIAACEAMRARGIGDYSIVGQVVGADGAPLRAVRYDVFRKSTDDTRAYWSGQTDERGTFVVCSVPRDAVFDIFVNVGRFHGSASYVVERPIGIVQVQLRPPFSP